MTVYPVLMEPSRRTICYSQEGLDGYGGRRLDMHIVFAPTEDDRCPQCGGEEWSSFAVVHCPVCREWACDMDADLFRAMHGCFGGSL